MSQSLPDSYLESLRIQAAAVVAQQAELTEHELRLVDRESALLRQEEQLGGRLEDQRRQLLDLQDQITEARMKLREKRGSAHATAVEQQARELTAAREEAANLHRVARAERQGLKDLRRRLLQRSRQHGQAHREEAAELRRQTERLAAERAAFVEQVKELNGRTELDKRRLKDAWERFHHERREWQDQRAAEGRAAAGRVRDLARRAKAALAGEKRAAAERARLDREVADRRRELEELETRIVNGRLRLLEQGDTRHETRDTRPDEVPLVSRVSCLVSQPAAAGDELGRKAEALVRLSDDLADQRLHLVEQAERLLRTQQEWHAERGAALREVERIAVAQHAREMDLERRSRELQAYRAAAHGEYELLGQLRLRLDAEWARAESRDADRRAEVLVRWRELDIRERSLSAREDGWRRLLRVWGRRRHREVLRLRDEQRTCGQERTEWVAVRTVWLRLAIRLRDERQALTARAAALERVRAETIEHAGGRAAVKRLERLERQWLLGCESAAQELDRLQATLTAEAVRLDDVSRRVRRDILAAEARAAVLDDRAAELEREDHALVAERSQTAGELDAARERQFAAEKRAIELREEVERLARLLIDAGPESEAVPLREAA